MNWKGLYGEEAFLLRPPIYESDYQAMREAKKLDFTALETRSRDYARQKAEAAGDNYEAMLAAAEEMRVRWIHPPSTGFNRSGCLTPPFRCIDGRSRGLHAVYLMRC